MYEEYMDEENQLLEKLENFVLLGEECNIEHLSIESGFSGLKYLEDTDAVPEILLKRPYQGDSSCQMICDRIEEWTRI